MTMRVLVCGGRAFDDRDAVFRTLDEINAADRITLLINGGAPGADDLSSRWARTRSVAVHIEPADWKKHGRAAGPIRNRRMLDEQRPDLVVAFPGGAGTNNMIALALKAGVQVKRV
jgi:predicted Rossmann-fold nucleotide-binding protein